MEPIPCVHCFDLFVPSPRHKNQTHCMKAECRRAKKAAWKRVRLKTDPDFKEDQRISNRKWAANHPGYWKEYRLKHPEKAQRNRLLQSLRNRRRRGQIPPIAKVDALKPSKLHMVGRYWLVPLIAKVDALKVNIVEIPDGYP
jgi:hypothetical protein